MPVTSPLQALQLGVRRLILQASGLLLFTAATIGASAAFAWPPRVHELVIAATLFLLVLRLSWIGISVILAPRRPQLRLVPVAAGAGALARGGADGGARAARASGASWRRCSQDGAAQAPHVANAAAPGELQRSRRCCSS